MSRKRKNAGEGYGYMFHGSFAKKADAVAKERKTKGAWIKSTLTNQGYRHIVMSPRTNPRKKKVKKEKQKNPSELLVMGANPSPVNKEQEIKIPLPGGGEVTIRSNPEPRANLNFGFGPGRPFTKKERAEHRREHKARVRARVKEERDYIGGLERSARESRKADKGKRKFHEIYGRDKAGLGFFRDNPICGARIGGEVCTRKPGHRGPHLPQGATMRTRTRLPRHWQPRTNPNAASLRERFTGREADSYFVMDEPHMPKGDYAQLGELLALYVKPLSGGQVQKIQSMANDRPIVVSDESARQIWFVGGDQDISSALEIFGAREVSSGIFEIGEARRIDYKQRKEHVPHPEKDEWRHEFGEETNVYPKVFFDRNAKRLLLEGGDYEIREEGIVN